MWVTCYTDASFSERHGGGFGVWLRSYLGRVVRSGRCPRYVKSSTDAELSAIYAGVFLALRAWPSRVAGVLVCTDCQAAIDLARPGSALAPRKAARRLQRRLWALLDESHVELDLRWVKAHQKPTTSTRAYLNHQCDRLARRGRKRRRTAPTK